MPPFSEEVLAEFRLSTMCACRVCAGLLFLRVAFAWVHIGDRLYAVRFGACDVVESWCSLGV